MANIRINGRSTIAPTGVVGIRSDKSERLPVSVLLAVMTTAAAICFCKILADGFLLFGSRSAEPMAAYYTVQQVRLFYFNAALGCALICTANLLPHHSFKATSGLFALYVIWYGSHYKAVANGFVRTVNKIVWAVLAAQGKTPEQYYLPYFEEIGIKSEQSYFMYTVVFGICFLLALVGVRRCSALWFTVISMSGAAVTMAFDCFTSENTFIVLVMLCIVMYSIHVQGYRRAAKKNSIGSFGNSLHIVGKYTSYSVFQQGIFLIVCSLIVIGCVSSVTDLSDYRRPEKAVELGNDIIYSAESIASGTFLDSLGFGTSNALNNGQLSRLGDLEYSGKTMFDIRSTQSSKPFYFRSYAAANYTGKRWEPLSGRTYRSYDFWKDFEENGFYPQFLYSGNGIFPAAAPNITADIKNRNINHKIFLTEAHTIPEASAEAFDLSTHKYDGTFIFSGFSGEVRYRQELINIYENRMLGSDYLGDIPEGDTQECMYKILHDGDFMNVYDMYLSDEYSMAYQNAVDRFTENERLYREFVAENYLSYPDNIGEYLPEDFDETISRFYGSSIQMLDGSDAVDNDLSVTGAFVTDEYYQLVEDYIRQYIQARASYTLTPGRTPSGRDFVEYFVNENGEGYCVHFASAAALMLRRAGIPARYCEGYYVGTDDMDSRYASPDGFCHIPDSRAHAWVEVYKPLVGWTAAEFTPSYSEGEIPDENKPFKPQRDSISSDIASDSLDESDSDTDTQTDSDTESETDTSSETDSALPDPDSASDRDSDSDASGIGSTAAVRKPSKLLRALMSVLKYLLWIIIAASAWIGVRRLVCYIRMRLFTRRNTRKGALSMYRYSLRILRLMKITRRKGEGEEAFALRSAALINWINPRELREFTKGALQARFGRSAPDDDTVAQMRGLIKKLLDGLYDSTPKWKKWIIKYLFFFD